jgi:hypothetical protein
MAFPSMMVAATSATPSDLAVGESEDAVTKPAVSLRMASMRVQHARLNSWSLIQARLILTLSAAL